MCGLFERERMRENKLASTAGKMIQVKKKATIRTSLLTKKQAHVHVRNVKLEFQEEKEEKRKTKSSFVVVMIMIMIMSKSCDGS